MAATLAGSSLKSELHEFWAIGGDQVVLLSTMADDAGSVAHLTVTISEEAAGSPGAALSAVAAALSACAAEMRAGQAVRS